MSILIKNMELPKNCADCRLCDTCECLRDFRTYEEVLDAVEDGDLTRDKNCPLVEIPVPHRRLIDVDDFMRHLINNVADIRTLSPSVVCNALRDTPTIIEAEGEG